MGWPGRGGGVDGWGVAKFGDGWTWGGQGVDMGWTWGGHGVGGGGWPKGWPD